MHPILARRGRILLYLAGWVPILALLNYLMWASGSTSWVQDTAVLAPACVLFAFACLSPWPICRVRPLRLANAAMLAATWAAAAISASALFTGAVWALARVEGRTAGHLDLLFGIGILLYLLSAGLHYAALAGGRSARGVCARRRSALAGARRGTARAANADQPALSVQLPALDRRADYVDSARAREMCIKLSDFLRSSLGLGQREIIPLSEELALARSYLEVEQVRFGARLQFTEDIQESCQDCAVPVLLLQPLVENAVKHGIAGLVEGGAVRLSVERLGGSVHVAVENGFDADAPTANRLGMGLPHVRRRLELRYGDAASMEAGGREGVYRVELRFPCESPIASSSRA